MAQSSENKPARKASAPKSSASQDTQAATPTEAGTLRDAAASFDRDSLGTSIRVYQLAKQLGVGSKDVTSALGELGIKKVAQSSVKKDEVLRLLDSLAGEQSAPVAQSEGNEPAPASDAPEADSAAESKPAKKSTRKTSARKSTRKAAPKPEAEAAEPEAPSDAVAGEEKPKRKSTRKSTRKTTRKATTKATGNETSQDSPEETPTPEEVPATATATETPEAPEQPQAVEQPKRRSTRKSTRKAAPKPEADKAAEEQSEQKPDSAVPENQDENKLRERVRKNVDNEIHQIEAKVEADLAAVAEQSANDEPLEDVTPEITPAPPAGSNPEAAAYAPLFVAPGADDTDDLEVEDLPGKDADSDSSDESPQPRRSRRRSSARRAADAAESAEGGDPEASTSDENTEVNDEPVAIKGSTRLEAQRRRRSEMREAGRQKKHIVSQAEFLARRESVERTMVVRERQRHDGPGTLTQVGVLEDELLVEHFVTSEAQASMIGNIYLGRVQNVLASMEAAFIDIGTGRNGVLYSTDIDWKSAGIGGRGRRIEQALKSGDQVLVQVSKDPLGHKGPRLTTQISLAGRFLVYVPGGRSAGISRKLPGPERKRLKEILGRVIPGKGGAIIRTAAENVPEDAIGADVRRLHGLWEDIQERAEEEKKSKGAKPVTLYEEPDMLVKVVRDLFNEDFTSLVIDGKRAWNIVHSYVKSVAPDLVDRLVKYRADDHDGKDAFEHHRVDEQIQKALGRKVWLPSGGSLVIDRTEAMVVIDVNTGKFTGAGGNLEETVTRNNLEAAEEIVRQMRLRDLGGMIVVDFIDMVLPENQDLVLRRLKEALGRDRTRHQVSEVTSLGLVQMTRKRLGTGLLETFSTECEHCAGRGIILHDDPVDEHDHDHHHAERPAQRDRHEGRGGRDHGRRQDTSKGRSGDDRRDKREDSDDDLEQIAASVIRDGVDTQQDEQDRDESREEQRSGQQSERRSSSRRRGRRGGGRGRGGRDHEGSQVSQERAQVSVSEDEQAAGVDKRTAGAASDDTSDIERIVSAALDTARESDPEEPSDADYVSEAAAPTGAGEKSFDEAVKEFEASPRRRRSTRGNSRSDHRPKREDFQQKQKPTPEPKPQPEAPVEDVRKSATSVNEPARAPEVPEIPEAKKASATRSRSGRRRAVRRSTATADTQRQAQQQPQQRVQKEEPVKEKTADAPRPTRGRRRATRRSTSRN